MSAIWALHRRNLGESRWLLLTLAFALFGLSWLFVFATHRNEVRLKGPNPMRAMTMLRWMGGPTMDFSTGAIDAAFWSVHVPIFILIVAVWAISRGSAGVAGEIERGTMDMILSRPITRLGYLASQASAALFGLLALAVAILAGTLVGSHFNSLASPPSAALLARPLLNLVALGFAIYGYTLFGSAVDLVRWRPNLISSFATLAGFIAPIVANLAELGDDYKWLERCSIFTAFDPVEAIVRGEKLAANAGVLALVGSIGLLGATVAFLRRDLPAGT